MTRWLAVGTLFALIALCLVWELWLAPSRLAIKALPLCIPIGGLLRRKMYTYRWVSLLVWVYFVENCWASRYSFQLAMKARMAVVNRPGAARGSMILRKA